MSNSGKRIVATNRQAKREFEIFDTIEAGMVLQGSEVKSLRNSQAQLAEAFCRIHDGEIWLNSCHISKYDHSSPSFSHEPDRPKKLLLHKREIYKLQAQVDQKGLTLIPLSMYFRNGKAKVELALARRKNLVDKRRQLAQREADREAQRAISQRMKQGSTD